MCYLQQPVTHPSVFAAACNSSDSEDFGPALTDALPPSGQESWPSAAYSELVDVLSSVTEKLSIEWPDEPCESQSSKLDEFRVLRVSSRTASDSQDYSFVGTKVIKES